jgi:hypothetical protein
MSISPIGSPTLRQVRTFVPSVTTDAPLSPESVQILGRENAKSPAELKLPANRAALAFEALKTNMGGLSDLREKRGGAPSTAWTFGQTMVAALETGDPKDFDQLVQKLDHFKEGGGYAPTSNGQHGQGHRYYDDNAWIGLAFMQAYGQSQDPSKKALYLSKAEEVFQFLKTGQQADGGLVWVEKDAHPTYNTCAEAPAVELALRLHMATHPHDLQDSHFQFADKVYQNMQKNLLISDGPNAGLYADNIDTGLKQRKDDIWAYNEGTPVGASVLMYQATGKTAYLDQARQTAKASLDYFAQSDRLWKQPPVFTAIYARNLAQLDAVAPDPAFHQMLEGYNSRTWSDALNSQSALFDRTGGDEIGHYGGGPGDISTLDQASLVQLHWLEAGGKSST